MFSLRDRRTEPDDPLLGRPASFGIHRYLQGSSNLFEENRLLKFAIVGLFGVTSVLGAVVYSSNQNQRTVVVPFGAGGDLYVTGSKPSAGYIRTITRNIVALAGTYSAYSADRQFQELLSLVHPSAYEGMRDSLNAILDELADNPTLSIATYIPAQTVILTPGASQRARANEDLLGPLVEEERAVSITLALFQDRVPASFSEIAPGTAGISLAGIPGARISERRRVAIDGSGLSASEYLVHAGADISLDERQFLDRAFGARIFAVSADRLALKAGETARLVIIRRGAAE